MTYIWINPVAECMTESGLLSQLLARHGLIQLRCRMDWGKVVKQEYAQLVRQTAQDGETIADARCPMAVELVRKWKAESAAPEAADLKIADVEPILIHCARELAARCSREAGPDFELLITTPCQALVDQGIALALPHTHFVTWNGLLRELGEQLQAPVSESPVPPGFFDSLPCRVYSATGRESILRLLTDGGFRNAELLELLYCPRGCHNGDGVKESAITGAASAP